MKIRLILSTLSIISLLTGCASIVDGGPKLVQINSNPEGAKVTISDKTGKEISVNTTPANVSLKRMHGYFDAENYKLVFEQPGYYPYETHVQSTINGWYLGNFVFGGIVGFLIVDPATGAMCTLSPNTLNCNLISSATPLTPDELKAAELKANPLPSKDTHPVKSTRGTR